jgi:ketosteroid isomerase-like protein
MIQDQLLQTLLDKEAIRELGLLYCRAIDRKDVALLRTLYTADATDTHGDSYDGGAEGYCAFIESSLPYMRYSGHHVCNHLVSVDGDTGEGEIYALAYHMIPDGQDGWAEDIMAVRYLDRYRKEADGKWRFAKRVVTYDYRSKRTITAEAGAAIAAGADVSYSALASSLFARGARS